MLEEFSADRLTVDRFEKLRANKSFIINFPLIRRDLQYTVYISNTLSCSKHQDHAFWPSHNVLSFTVIANQLEDAP